VRAWPLAHLARSTLLIVAGGAWSYANVSWVEKYDSAFHFGGEIRPLLDTEGAQVTNRDREPRESFEGVQRSEEVRQVLVVAGVNTALTPFEVEGGKEVRMSA